MCIKTSSPGPYQKRRKKIDSLLPLSSLPQPIVRGLFKARYVTSHYSELWARYGRDPLNACWFGNSPTYLFFSSALRMTASENWLVGNALLEIILIVILPSLPFPPSLPSSSFLSSLPLLSVSLFPSPSSLSNTDLFFLPAPSVFFFFKSIIFLLTSISCSRNIKVPAEQWSLKLLVPYIWEAHHWADGENHHSHAYDTDMKKEVVFQIQENSEHSTLEIEKPSITNVQPAFTFLNLLPSACSFRASAGSLWMQLTHFRIGAFFQYSVLLASAKNDFLPLPGQAKWFSSIKCQTHNSLLAQSHLWLFQPDGCLPLRLLWHLWIKHSLLVVLCSRNAAKSFLTFP